jgi:hypothetical protein
MLLTTKLFMIDKPVRLMPVNKCTPFEMASVNVNGHTVCVKQRMRSLDVYVVDHVQLETASTMSSDMHSKVAVGLVMCYGP